MIEVAARSIGGLCSRTLTFGAGMSLEEIILRHALRLPIPTLERERRAAGVMMIPIPAGGILEEVEGLEEARAVPLVEDVVIAMHKGQPVVPLPEGSQYLGFIFARADTPAAAEAALRRGATARSPVRDPLKLSGRAVWRYRLTDRLAASARGTRRMRP